MKLQILIPHYHETADVIRPLLDSIAIQQNVDFSEIGVIICHDGNEPSIDNSMGIEDSHPAEDESKEFEFYDNHAIGGSYSIFKSYPFKIEQVHIPHKGVSAARNGALDAATADYVMFCDADDMFYNACGLWIIFREIENGGFDGLISVFVEETRHPQTNEVIYINHENDSTFVHGKVWNRSYLTTHKIRWNDKLTIHEDSYFNMLAMSMSKNSKLCTTPFYLWKWRDESVCRHDPKYILKTYRNMLDSNDALVDELASRGLLAQAAGLVVFMVFDAYYALNKPEWVNQENQEYRQTTERHFCEYFRKHRKQWNEVSDQDKMQVSSGVRNRSVMEGMQMERQTIDEWLKHIEEL